MNLLPKEGLNLIRQLVEFCNSEVNDRLEVVISPPMLYLSEAAAIKRPTRFSLAAQNCHQKSSGAYTGEVSPTMIKATGAELVILGHSERRQLFGETDEALRQKLLAVMDAGLIPILCVGEDLEQRQQGRQEDVVQQQLAAALQDLKPDQAESIIIAYEPVWAIGTGETATPKQAQAMHHYIRQWLSRRFHAMAADEVSILYGGSVKPDNARELFSCPDIDGGLIGGASLKYESFVELIRLGRQYLR